MTTPAAAKPRAPDPVLQALRAQFAVVRDCKPLAIGIHKVIAERLPELGKEQIKSAMRRHTVSTTYLKALATGTVRFDLDGNAQGEVTPEQQQQAAELIRERLRKGAERKRLEQKEKAAAEAAQRKAQETQLKLAQLAEKFARR